MGSYYRPKPSPQSYRVLPNGRFPDINPLAPHGPSGGPETFGPGFSRLGPGGPLLFEGRPVPGMLEPKPVPGVAVPMPGPGFGPGPLPAVPEPSSWLMLVMGLAALVGRHVRRAFTAS